MLTAFFSCGHNVDFVESGPSKGDKMYCRICWKLVQVERIKNSRKVSKNYPKPDEEEDEQT